MQCLRKPHSWAPALPLHEAEVECLLNVCALGCLLAFPNPSFPCCPSSVEETGTEGSSPAQGPARGGDLECAPSWRLLRGERFHIPSSGQRGHSRGSRGSRGPSFCCPSPQCSAKQGRLQPGRGKEDFRAPREGQCLVPRSRSVGKRPDAGAFWKTPLSTALPISPPPPVGARRVSDNPLQAQPCPSGSLGESEACSSPQFLRL